MKRIFLILLCAAALDAKIDQAPNHYSTHLQKVFHHRMAPTGNSLSHIELAKIVLYFDNEPVVKTSQPGSSKKDLQEIVFFISNAVITSDEAKQMVSQLNNAQQENYSAAIRLVQKPAAGLEIKFSYNPKKVMISYDTFDAITKAKSVEFRLLNKTLLDALKQKKDQSVLRTSYHTKPTVIIDCGHGGNDTGTISNSGVKEKDVALAIGLQLANELKTNGFKVVFTRQDDRFVALDERTAIANRISDTAILISLHANNCSRADVQGLETFCLASNLFTKNTGLETAIDVMIQASDEQRNAQSKKLAQSVHSAVLHAIKENGYTPHDRKVRHAATQMLMGIRWPGILIETDYLSGPAARLLEDPNYQKMYAQGICKGIKNCF
jgi:N-acetylmuramoyl-L-alanine amidase